MTSVEWKTNRVLFGGDYNPEQWSKDVWREDVRLMGETGVNLVIVGIFSWAWLEPRPGAREFGWLDELLDLLHEGGVGVSLATPTASPPPWMGDRWPQTLPCYEDGVRLGNTSRNHYCMSSPVYREFAAGIVTDLAERYATHPALRFWHVNNEYGTTCFCSECGNRFRIWLQDRYGSIEGLNEAWGTAFWSQRYDAWTEINPPRQAVYHSNPTQLLDYKRFCSDALLDCFRKERDIIRRHSDLPVTTNFQDWERRVDGWRWGAEMDVVGIDLYPDPGDPNGLVEAALYGAMVMDLTRSEGSGKPWLLMEQAPSAPGWAPVASPKAPGLFRLWSYQALARGSDSLLQFQWRTSRQGTEKFHIGMIPHAGTETRVYREMRELGHELRDLDGVVGTPVHTEVAILHSWDSWWAAESDEVPSERLKVMDQIHAWYRPLWQRSVTVDFAPPGRDLTRYKMVLAPNLYLVSDDEARRLAEYVAAGGTLVVGPFSGVVDPDDRVRPDGYPGCWRELLGVRGEEFWPLREHQSVACESKAFGNFTGRIWAEWLTADGAEVMASIHGGPLDGRPAVTRNQYGAGIAWYVSTCPDPDALALILRTASDEAGVEPVLPDLPFDVEAVRRGDKIFLLDHSNRTVTIREA
ncbi:beta-galactosidase [Streptomyces sp. NPDC002088]|uniref:beta-galactosidase n=1 Tax=Streptomyces sp. NPDC002088 TaxID=3154665 RepID=UPI00332E6315